MLVNTSHFDTKAIEAAEYILRMRMDMHEDFQVSVIAPAPPKKHPLRFLRKVNTSIKSVAIYQLVTGLLSLQAFIALSFESFLTGFVGTLFILTNLIALAAGILLFNKKEIGFNLSIIYFVLTGLVAGAGGLYYYSVGLFSLFIVIELTNGIQFRFLFDTLPTTAIYMPENKPLAVGVNFVSILALYILTRGKDRLREEGVFTNNIFTDNLNFKNTDSS